MLAAVNPISHDFRRLTRAMAKDSPQGDERGRVADVTLRSRDAFTRERVWSIRGLNLPPLQRKVELAARHLLHHLAGLEEAVHQLVDVADVAARPLGDAAAAREFYERALVVYQAAGLTALAERVRERLAPGGALK